MKNTYFVLGGETSTGQFVKTDDSSATVFVVYEVPSVGEQRIIFEAETREEADAYMATVNTVADTVVDVHVLAAHTARCRIDVPLTVKLMLAGQSQEITVQPNNIGDFLAECALNAPTFPISPPMWTDSSHVCMEPYVADPEADLDMVFELYCAEFLAWAGCESPDEPESKSLIDLEEQPQTKTQ